MFCFYLKKFDFSEKRIELTIPKVYINDPGLANYLLSGSLSENIGRLMENVVSWSLRRESLWESGLEFFILRMLGGVRWILSLKRAIGLGADKCHLCFFF